MNCPYKNSPEWISLQSQFGTDVTEKLYNINKGDIPSIKKAEIIFAEMMALESNTEPNYTVDTSLVTKENKQNAYNTIDAVETNGIKRVFFANKNDVLFEQANHVEVLGTDVSNIKVIQGIQNNRTSGLLYYYEVKNPSVKDSQRTPITKKEVKDYLAKKGQELIAIGVKNNRVEYLNPIDTKRLIGLLAAETFERLESTDGKENLIVAAQSVLNDKIIQLQSEGKSVATYAGKNEFFDNYQTIVKGVVTKLSKYKSLIDEVDDVDNTEENGSDLGDFDREVLESALFSKIDNQIKLFLSFIVYEDVDGIEQVANEQNLYNSILKAVTLLKKGTILEKLELFASKGNVQVQALVNKLKSDVIVDGVVQPRYQRFWNKFTKTFEKTRLKEDKVIIRVSETGRNVFIKTSDEDMSINKQLAAASTRYVTIVKSQYATENGKKYIDELYSDVVKSFSNKDVEMQAIAIKDFLEAVGLPLSEFYISSSFGLLDIVDPSKFTNLTKDVVDFIYSEVKNGNNPYTTERAKQQNQVAAKMRLKSVLGSNSLFDESVLEDNYVDANNNRRWSYAEQSYISLTHDLIQTEEGRQAFLEEEPYLQNNLFFKLSVEDRKAIFSAMDLSLSGSVQVSDNTQNSAGSGETTFKTIDENGYLLQGLSLLSSFSTAKVGSQTVKFFKILPKQWEAKSTAYNVAMPFNISTNNEGELVVVDKLFDRNGKEMRLNTFGRKELLRNLNYELDRISNTQDQINQNKDLIQDYHTGKQRGLKLFSFGFLSPDLKARLEDRAKNKEDRTSEDYKNDLIQAANEISNKISNDFNNYLQLLIDNKVLTINPQGKLVAPQIPSASIQQFVERGSVANEENILDFLSHYFVNYSVNAFRFNQLYMGDLAYRKDFIDTVKRGGGELAFGPSAYREGYETARVAYIQEPSRWVYLDNKKSVGKTDADIQQEVDVLKELAKQNAQESGVNEKEEFQRLLDQEGLKQVENADGQAYMSADRFINVQLSLGNTAESHRGYEILDKVKLGIPITFEERNFLIKNELIPNSVKGVYFNRNVYHKLSYMVLTKEFTSMLKPSVQTQVDKLLTATNGNYTDEVKALYANEENWIPLPGKTTLHNLRVKMADPSQRIDEVLPKSASKIATKIQAKLENNEYDFQESNITTIDNNYWRLQVKNPAGKVEITQGSQLIQLIDSEQDPNTIVSYKGREITVSELRDEYQRGLSQIRDSKFLQARSYLNSDGKINKKLLDKLRRNIAATNPDSELLDFLELINNNDPKYNLNLPQIREKFENMMVGHLLKRSLRQKLPGLKCAVISDHGYNIVRQAATGKVISSQQIKASPQLYINEDGSLKEGFVEDRLRFSDRTGDVTGFTEVCIPAYLAEMYNLKAGDDLPPSLSEIFGIRIPTEDKRSMMKAKIVEVLPAHMGNSIMVPSERIVYSGEDYDIDSIFIYRNEVYTDIDGNIRSYGSAITPDERFYEYMQYIKKQEDFIETREELEETDEYYNEQKRILDEQEMNIIINELGLENINDLKNKISILKQNLLDIEKELSESSTEVITQAKFEFILRKVWGDRLLGYRNALLRIKTLQQDKKNLHKYLNNKTLEALNLPISMEQLMSVESTGIRLNNYEISNDLVQSLFKLYDNRSVQDIINSPNDLSEMNELADMFGSNQISQSKNVMYETPFGTYNAWKSNKDGKENIGPVAKSNLSIAALTRNGVELSVDYGIAIDGFKDTFAVTQEDDVILKKSPTGELYIAGFKSRRKGESLANLLSAMADNAKNQHANKLNLTYDTVGLAAYFLGLGLGNSRTMLLMNQAVVKRFATELSAANAKLSGESVFASTIINNIKKELVAKIKKQFNIKSEDDMPDSSLTTEELVENYNNPQLLLDYKVILQIEKAANATLTMIDLGNVLGLNKSIKEFSTIEIDNVLNSYNRFMNSEVFTSLSRQRMLDKDTNILSNIQKLVAAKSLVAPYLFKYSPIVQGVSNYIFGQTNKASRQSKAAVQLKNQLNQHIATALSIRYLNRQRGISSFNDIFYELAEQFPYLNTGKYGDVKTNLLEEYNDIIARNPMMQINPFLSLLNFNVEGGKVSISSNSFVQRTPDISKLIKDGFEELRRKHPQFADSLLNYLKNNTGFEFMGGTFIMSIPAKEFLDQSTVIDILQDPNFNEFSSLLYEDELSGIDATSKNDVLKRLSDVLLVDFFSQYGTGNLVSEGQYNRLPEYAKPLAFLRFKNEKNYVVVETNNGEFVERELLYSPFKSGHIPYRIKENISKNGSKDQVDFVKNVTQTPLSQEEKFVPNEVKFNNSGVGLFAQLGPNVNADIAFKDASGIEFKNVQSFVYGQLVVSKAKREELARLSSAEAVKAFFNELPAISKRYDLKNASPKVLETINALYILGYSKMLSANPNLANLLKESGGTKIEFTGQLSNNEEVNQRAISRIENAVAYNRQVLQQEKTVNQSKYVSYTLSRDNNTYKIVELEGLTFNYMDEGTYSITIDSTGTTTMVKGNLFQHINKAFEFDLKGNKDGSGKVSRLTREGFAKALSSFSKISFETIFNNTKENFGTPSISPTTTTQPSTQATVSSDKVLEGDIFALPGIPVITTNLGGVHGAGLAQAAKAKGLIKQGEGDFKATSKVVRLPVKKVWSDNMSMNDNMELLKNSLRSLIKVAKANTDKTFLLPLAGLGHGEGSIQDILPLLINTVQASPNIKLVIPAENVSLGRQGSVRKDYTRENMPTIKAMLTQAGLLGTQPSTTIKTISEPYGVVTTETTPSAEKTQQFVDVIQPQIQAQAYKENASGTANDMFMYGLRWTRKSTSKQPLINKSYANKGLPTNDAKAKDPYVYDTLDQNGNPLAPVSDLQPIIAEIEKSLGIDMSNYDAVIGNIYLPGQNIATHRDTTESLSARNYPVVVYTIGNDSGINVYENEKNPGAPSFASDKKVEIKTTNGTIYTFGMDGKGRFEVAHDTPKNIKRDQKFPPITLPNGTVVENYTITLTFRRAADLEAGMPTTPNKITTTQQVTPIKSGVQEVFDSNPELANIGTAEQYSAYLDTIFPDSKVKDILYHGSHTDFTFRDYITSQPEYTGSITTAVWVDGVRDDDRSIIRSLSDAEKKEYQKNGRIKTGEGFYQKDGTIKYFKNSELDKLYNEGKFEKFKKRDHSYAGMDTFLGTGNYFTTSLKDAKLYARNKLYAVIADIKNAYTENKGYSNSRSGKGSQELIDKGYDAVTEKVNNGQEYNIFEPEQIHILGNKQDVEGFKEFVNSNTKGDNKQGPKLPPCG
jgi:hypothetical protein